MWSDSNVQPARSAAHRDALEAERPDPKEGSPDKTKKSEEKKKKKKRRRRRRRSSPTPEVERRRRRKPPSDDDEEEKSRKKHRRDTVWIKVPRSSLAAH